MKLAIIDQYPSFQSFPKFLKSLLPFRMRTFLDKQSTIKPTQYMALRLIHSTSHAKLDISATTFDNINQNKYTALLLLNLKKSSRHCKS